MQNGNGPDKRPPNTPPQRSGPNMSYFLVIGFLLTFLLNMVMINRMPGSSMEVDYSQFVKLVDAGIVREAQIGEEELFFRLSDEASAPRIQTILGPAAEDAAPNSMPQQLSDQALKSTAFFTGKVEDDQLTQRFLDNGVRFQKVVVRSNPILDFLSTWIFPIAIMYLLYMVFFRGLTKRMGSGMGGMMNVGKSKAKMFDPEKNVPVTFQDVAGQDEAKESLMEIVDLLHNPDKYAKIGAKQPKGALLVGPPGTGKTLLARAVAGEAKVPFFSLSGSEFVEMFVGVGASRVRDLFEQANKQAPCIIFIDEIDAIGKKRDGQITANDEREQTLNQLLAEMDGFDGTRGLMVLAATNRPEILDQALLRPGRFDRQIVVDKPDLPGREAILKVHARKVQLGEDINLREIAFATSGATGADLANMVNEAALRAVRLGRAQVSQADLLEAVEVVIAGKEKKDRILNPKEKRMVAYHEVGHALASALQTHSQPVQKITIVPRTMGSLGYTMNMPEEERYLLTKSELLSQITTLLAGRAAEELIFGESSTGASNDIERATRLARAMVTQYGMSDRFGMMALETSSSRYLDPHASRSCSEASGAEIDEEVRKILAGCRQTADALLQSRREQLVKISEFLIDKENITGKEFMDILEDRTEI